MRKILTHFSRNFAKIAKEVKYFKLSAYSAIHYRREKLQYYKRHMKHYVTFLCEMDWRSSFPYICKLIQAFLDQEKNFREFTSFPTTLSKHSVEKYYV